jgi:hypothetical protein
MFAVIFFVIALIGATVQVFVQKRPRTRARVLEVVLVWQLAVSVGVGSIFAAAAHLFFPDQVARSIGWATGSPFQMENAFGDLGYGALGVLCIWFRNKFWEATVIMSSISLLGDAYGHIYQLVAHNDHAPDNAGAILYMDIIIPLVVIVLLVALRATAERQPDRG